MTKKQPTRRRGWKRRTAVWVVVCAVLGLATTVGVAWFGTWDSQRKDRWFKGQVRVDAIHGGEREDVGGAWSILSTHMSTQITASFHAIPPERQSITASDDDDDDDDVDEIDEDEEDNSDTQEDAEESVELALPELPELHEIPHGTERWGKLNFGENPALTEAELPPYAPGSGFGLIQQQIAAGWPRLALWSQRKFVGPASNRTETFDGAWLIEKGTGYRGKSTYWWLPLLPIWRGLLIDTAFWGAVWFVLLWPTGLVAAKAKRARRRAKGKCPWCKYDLRGIESERCPECGGERQPTPRL